MLEELKQKVLEANLLLPKYGLVTFTWGNVSGVDRASGFVVIKPSGLPYEGMTAADMVVVDLDGRMVEGRWKPSSDTPTHVELYKAFPSIGGVVHTHSTFATSWAQAGRDIPCYGTTHADYFYGTVPCLHVLGHDQIAAEYERNTGRLIVSEFKRLGLDPDATPAALCKNHGPFAWGSDPLDAVHGAVVLEECARMAYYTEQIDPAAEPIRRDLLDKHFFRKHGKTAYYGQN